MLTGNVPPEPTTWRRRELVAVDREDRHRVAAGVDRVEQAVRRWS